MVALAAPERRRFFCPVFDEFRAYFITQSALKPTPTLVVSIFVYICRRSPLLFARLKPSHRPHRVTVLSDTRHHDFHRNTIHGRHPPASP
jgi:hypothetical protein